MTDSPSKYDGQRLTELALQKCMGVLSPDQLAELSHLLSTSQQARDEYWEIIAVHSQLEWDLHVGADNEPALSERPSPIDSSAPGKAAETIAAGQPTIRFALAASILVAALAGGWVWWHRTDFIGVQNIAGADNQQADLAPTLANVTALVEESNWSFDDAESNRREFREGDTIVVADGAVEFTFATDTSAVLEAPASLQLVATDRVRLIQGSVKVDVAKGDEGFTVETPSAEVIDLGTVFSVNFAGGNTDLVVFDGEVDLKLHNSAASLAAVSESQVTRFRAGEAVQVGKDGTLSRIVTVRQSRVANNRGSETEIPVIAEVSDNNIRDDFYSFYEIVPGGMQEDAPAFVDRPHQWNGIRKAGMPSYLAGGDYVKTFNDDKVAEELHIELTLDRPATLYVLLDKRVTPPSWLLDSFENTGDEIGVDEAPYFPGKEVPGAESRLAVGAGNRIDRKHTIWRREVAAPGVVALGANGPLADDGGDGVLSKANMYGVVAVPREGNNVHRSGKHQGA